MESRGTRDIQFETIGPRSINKTETSLSSLKRDATTHPAVPPRARQRENSAPDVEEHTADYDIIEFLKR